MIDVTKNYIHADHYPKNRRFCATCLVSSESIRRVSLQYRDGQRQFFTWIHGNVKCEGRQKRRYDFRDDDVEQIVGKWSFRVDVELCNGQSFWFFLGHIKLAVAYLWHCELKSKKITTPVYNSLMRLHSQIQPSKTIKHAWPGSVTANAPNKMKVNPELSQCVENWSTYPIMHHIMQMDVSMKIYTWSIRSPSQSHNHGLDSLETVLSSQWGFLHWSTGVLILRPTQFAKTARARHANQLIRTNGACSGRSG